MRSPRGYSLQMVLMLLAVLAVAVGAMLTAIVSSGRVSGDMLNRRRAFYACDGLSRVVVSLAQEYLSTKTDQTLREYVCARGGGCSGTELLPDITPPGFSVTSFDIDTPDGAESGVIPSGPFQGMRGLLQGVEFNLRSKKDASGFVCEADQSVTLAKIAMFQFFLFGDGYIDWFPGPPQDVKGRAHANGDFCFGSDNTFRLSRVTSAGRLVHGSHSACRAGKGTGSTNARVLEAGKTWSTADDDFSMWNNDTDHGCTTCGGGSLSWQAYAADTWGANAQDKAHGVSRLRLPITGTPETQPGRTTTGTKVSNDENSRLLVDPVRADDGDDLLRQKFACKADIRIINGVWYLRESPTESDPCDWPGTPIWSDHPGSFSSPVTDENGVETYVRGQGDLRAERSWGTTPFRYSYYRTTSKAGGATAALLNPDSGQRPVVSYGSLFRVSGDEWVPGHWVESGTQATYCTIGSGGLTGFQSAFTTGGGLCSTLGLEVVPAALLNGTRSGFRNGHIEKLSPGDSTERWRRSRVLPINVDVAALIGALQDTDAGELGSYFGTGSLTGRDFNGIVYVTSIWPGAMDGMDDSDYARFWPSHGSRTNASTSQPNSHAHAQRALPQPFCANNAGNASQWGEDDRLTSSIGDDFRIPACTDFDDEDEGSWPNAVRVINARDLLPADNTVLPNGLTIATNLPAYLLGDVNATSDVSSEAAADWKPFLMAGDQVTLLSRNWNDATFGWNTTDGSEPTAAETRYHMAMLAGWTESESGNYSGGIENFPRFLENWGGVKNHIVGSLVLGFHSVYYRWSRDGAVYTAPNRQWAFDEHFNSIPNQPPGAPLYDVYAIKRWKR